VSPEEELVRGCVRGDPGAWKAFVDLYSGWIMRVVRATLRRHTGTVHEADAEDVVAEVFRQLVDRERALLRSFRAPFNLRAWLGVLARRSCNRLLRKKSPVPPPGDPAAPRQQPGGLEDLLCRLPVEDRVLLQLFFVHECSYEDIAEILGISVESVGKQKFRALQKLRESAKHEGL
jgi:DNA-directed RNA polymerase specialized sigma24 family protein